MCLKFVINVAGSMGHQTRYAKRELRRVANARQIAILIPTTRMARCAPSTMQG